MTVCDRHSHFQLFFRFTKDSTIVIHYFLSYTHFTMKFRKVGTGTAVASSNSVATGQWTTSSGGHDSAGGCAVAVKSASDGILPVSTSPTELAGDSTHKDDDATIRVGEEETIKMDIAEEKSQDSAEEPSKPKDVQYAPETEKNAPPKAIIDHFYNRAMEQGANKEDNTVASNQRVLSDAGLLSFEDVLLPAIAHQENQALKKMQRKVQRDIPEQTHILIAGRAAVCKSLGAAVLAVQKCRGERRIVEQTREETWAEERRVKRLERQVERTNEQERLNSETAKAEEVQKLKEKRELKKKFGPNQELWREVAYLMTESSKLDRERRLWQEAETMFEAAEKDLESREIAQQKQQEASTTNDVDMEGNEENADPHPTVNMQPFDTSMEDIMKSSNSIQAALKLVTETMTDAGKLRKNLYRRYRQDHQFEGYRGVNDPKGLIRILSQDTEA